MFLIFPTQNNVSAATPPFLAFSQWQQPISVIETPNIREHGENRRSGKNSLAEWPIKGLNTFTALSDASGNMPQGRFNLNEHITYCEVGLLVATRTIPIHINRDPQSSTVVALTFRSATYILLNIYLSSIKW